MQTVQFALADFDKSRLLCKDARTFDATKRVLRGLAVVTGKITLLINIHIELVPTTLT